MQERGWYYLVVRASSARRGAVLAQVPEARSAGASSSSSASDLADLPRGVPDDDRPRGDVADDDGAGSDVGLLADLDRGAQNRPAADAAPRRIVGPRRSPCRRSVRPMKLSFVVITPGAMKTSSSSVEYAGDVRVRLDLRQRPDRRVVLDERPTSDDHVVARSGSARGRTPGRR